MVEVSPKKGEIAVKAGGMIFSFLLLIVFPLLFHFIPNQGANWVIIGVAALLAVLFDLWYFQVQILGGLFVALLIGAFAVARHFWL